MYVYVSYGVGPRDCAKKKKKKKKRVCQKKFSVSEFILICKQYILYITIFHVN